ncbi:MerR family DNA-binding transcriptional regulator [Candidatus Parcubacteria bacterium]|nr:MerR family DNA-binding transcriptional regulator [Patescibacteria group bacterium]MBU4482388.1 MerR family DNA-binding transcriptional regulator [Patescibacteria group bacterium]MCG2687173.1 MerR family DNA-binding transcriptional regulator [Candidatus Parcubacteria bacterium]
MLKLLTIKQTSDKLGVSSQTLRRWDKSGQFASIRNKDNNYRCYKKEDIEDYIKNNTKDLFKIARNWVIDDLGTEPQKDFYCQDSIVFQARLERLKNEMSKMQNMEKTYSLIVGIAGEIGSNSFDHNLGNWPDIRGMFFAYNLKKRKIILADRGQGILTTLKKVKPELINHQNALQTAFTEVISGRAPEARGNGLKFVRQVVSNNEINLFFQSGDAELRMEKNNFDLYIKKSTVNFHGCLVLIHF